MYHNLQMRVLHAQSNLNGFKRGTKYPMVNKYSCFVICAKTVGSAVFEATLIPSL